VRLLSGERDVMCRIPDIDVDDAESVTWHQPSQARDVRSDASLWCWVAVAWRGSPTSASSRHSRSAASRRRCLRARASVPCSPPRPSAAWLPTSSRAGPRRSSVATSFASITSACW